MVERLRRRALRENRFDDANDDVIKRRLEVYERDTAPVLDFYPKDEKIVKLDATMSQIRVLHEILEVLVPIKEHRDQQHQNSGVCGRRFDRRDIAVIRVAQRRTWLALRAWSCSIKAQRPSLRSG